jgi:ArsR family transcriptional regulator
LREHVRQFPPDLGKLKEFFALPLLHGDSAEGVFATRLFTATLWHIFPGNLPGCEQDHSAFRGRPRNAPVLTPSVPARMNTFDQVGSRALLALRPGMSQTRGGGTPMPADPQTDLSVSTAARLFAQMGDPTRLRLLLVLRDRGEACVGDLAAAVGLSQTSVSAHLMRLRLAGVVACERRGHHVFYRLASSPAAGLLEHVVPS